jgi:DNA-binding HxlR family transcriptional regulator
MRAGEESCYGSLELVLAFCNYKSYNLIMKKRDSSVCPIVYSLDIWGDSWSLVILRDILIHNKRYFREFLASREGIATNILSNRLRR